MPWLHGSVHCFVTLLWRLPCQGWWQGGRMHGGPDRRSVCWASRGSPGGSVFYLDPVFECLEVLLSRCFLAHAGSVYKKRLKARPLRAAQGIGLQMDAGSRSPALCQCQGHRVTFGRTFPLPFRGAAVSPVVNKSLKCLLFLFPPLLQQFPAAFHPHGGWGLWAAFLP